MRTGLALAALVLTAQSAAATDWYVDGLNGNDSNPGTWQLPFASPWKGISEAGPGDTVHILPTITYASIGVYGKSGTASAPITVQGDGVNPLTSVNGHRANFGIQVNVDSNGAPSSYINIKNFDVKAPGPWYGIYVGQGCHHVVISGNLVHGSGNGGIGTGFADYVTVSGNTVYNNAQYTANGIYGSGISFWDNTDIDGNTGVKMIVSGNIVYNNTNKPQSGGYDTDGNGIILDDSRHTESDGNAYGGKTLIENDIVYGNGGRGISTYESDHAIIVNNTAYKNNADPYESAWEPGEIMLAHSGDSLIYNNAGYSAGGSSQATGQHVGLTVEDGSGDPITVDYNLLYNLDGQKAEDYLGTGEHVNYNTVTFGANNIWGDPLFKNASNRNFMLKSNSPGIGTALPSEAPRTDIRGKSRPRNGPTEMAAYQQGR